MRARANPEHRPQERDVGVWALVVPGLTYPLWHLLAPTDAVDPWWVWFVVAASFLLVAVLHVAGLLSRESLFGAVPALAGLVALHFFLLASLNDMSPFYAVGSTMAGLAPILFIRSRGGVVVYGCFLAALSGGLYLEHPDARKLAYWGSLIPVLAFGYYQTSVRVRHRRALEEAVAHRTRQLSEANHHLRREMEERERLQNELRVSHKMEAIGRLSGAIAHDFNNVLATIEVCAELLEKGLAANDERRVGIERILDAARQGSVLAQQLLTVGRRSPVPLTVVDLGEVVGATAPVLRLLVGPDVDVVPIYEPGAHPILANRDQVQRILVNLVTNARDAIEGHGCIRITTSSCVGEPPGPPDGSDAPGPRAYVCLSVEDDGQGMGPETLARMFDPFFTTKGPDRGAGLGLAIVHGIVSQAGGFIRARSKPGRGSRFELCWPRVDEPDLPAGQS